ncbi:unnamed protein product [Closterium sp. Yama58-4]|nr:unnamed protein product [Closterium sp. Yama58-4]
MAHRPVPRLFTAILILSLLVTARSSKVFYSLTRYEQTGNAICLKARDDNAAAATQSGAFDLNYADIMFAGVNPGASIRDGNGICYDSAAPDSASFLDIQYYVNITSFGRTYIASLPTRLLPAAIAQASFSVSVWWNRVTGADDNSGGGGSGGRGSDGTADGGAAAAAAAAAAASAAAVAAGADTGESGSLSGQQQQQQGGADVVVLKAVNKASKPLDVIGAPTLVTLDPADSPKLPTTETVAAPAAAYSLRYTTFDIALRYVLPKYLTPTYASNGQLSFAPRTSQPGASGAAAILFASERDAVYAGGVTWIVSYLVHRPDPSPSSVGFQFMMCIVTYPGFTYTRAKAHGEKLEILTRHSVCSRVPKPHFPQATPHCCAMCARMQTFNTNLFSAESPHRFTDSSNPFLPINLSPTSKLSRLFRLHPPIAMALAAVSAGLSSPVSYSVGNRAVTNGALSASASASPLSISATRRASAAPRGSSWLRGSPVQLPPRGISAGSLGGAVKPVRRGGGGAMTATAGLGDAAGLTAAAYGASLLFGGLFAYIRTGSKYSLGGGLTGGALFATAFYLIQSAQTESLGNALGFGAGLLFCALFAIRLFLTGKPMPAAPLLAFSAAATAVFASAYFGA